MFRSPRRAASVFRPPRGIMSLVLSTAGHLMRTYLARDSSPHLVLFAHLSARSDERALIDFAMEEPMRLSVRPALAAAVLIIVSAAAHARPEYARKENKACGYCHVSPAGGGARNPRGMYYALHNHTFEGYNEARVMGNAGGGEGGRK